MPVICFSLVGLSSLLGFLALSVGGIGILGVAATLVDDYVRDPSSSLQ